MQFRDAGFVQPLGVLLALLLALTALAWSAHIDWPAGYPQTDNGQTGIQAHVETTALDDATGGMSPPQAQTADSGSHSDHCSHSSAHLVGLGVADVGLGAAPLVQTLDFRPQPYDSIVRQPLIDPPIA